MALTALDILVILLVGAGLVFGWLRGFVAEVLSLFAWFLAILALRYAARAGVASCWSGPIGTASGAAVLAFVLDLRPRLRRRQVRLAPGRAAGCATRSSGRSTACSAPASAR